MAALPDITIRHEIRECTVNGKPGYFHCWEHCSNPGGASAGVVSFVRALVEFPEGMGYVDPKDIQFCDETHAVLCAWNKYVKEAAHD